VLLKRWRPCDSKGLTSYWVLKVFVLQDGIEEVGLAMMERQGAEPGAAAWASEGGVQQFGGVK